MQIVELYRYVDGGKSIITPNKRNESDEPYKYRVIAAEGMLAKRGDIEVCAIDTEYSQGWEEVIDKDYKPYELGEEINVLFE